MKNGGSCCAPSPTAAEGPPNPPNPPNPTLPLTRTRTETPIDKFDSQVTPGHNADPWTKQTLLIRIAGDGRRQPYLAEACPGPSEGPREAAPTHTQKWKCLSLANQTPALCTDGLYIIGIVILVFALFLTIGLTVTSGCCPPQRNSGTS